MTHFRPDIANTTGLRSMQKACDGLTIMSCKNIGVGVASIVKATVSPRDSIVVLQTTALGYDIARNRGAFYTADIELVNPWPSPNVSQRNRSNASRSHIGV